MARGNDRDNGAPQSTDVADLVRASRRFAGHTQAQLAEHLGTTQSAVSRWERGHEEPRLSTLRAILAACGRTLVLETTAAHDGVDRAQIRQHLAMTPDQRLLAIVNMSEMLAGARRLPT